MASTSRTKKDGTTITKSTNKKGVTKSTRTKTDGTARTKRKSSAGTTLSTTRRNADGTVRGMQRTNKSGTLKKRGAGSAAVRAKNRVETGKGKNFAANARTATSRMKDATTKDARKAARTDKKAAMKKVRGAIRAGDARKRLTGTRRKPK